MCNAGKDPVCATCDMVQYVRCMARPVVHQDAIVSGSCSVPADKRNVAAVTQSFLLTSFEREGQGAGIGTATPMAMRIRAELNPKAPGCVMISMDELAVR